MIIMVIMKSNMMIFMIRCFPIWCVFFFKLSPGNIPDKLFSHLVPLSEYSLVKKVGRMAGHQLRSIHQHHYGDGDIFPSSNFSPVKKPSLSRRH